MWDRIRAGLLERPAVYGALQAPLHRWKIAPFLRHNEVASFRKVLELGCGPGTNAALFAQAQLVGLDLNSDYIEHARRRFAGRFEVVDLCRWEAPPDAGYDCVFINSLLHHLDDETTRHLLAQAKRCVAPGGFVHTIELVTAAPLSLADLLVRLDRGDFARSLQRWNEMFSEFFSVRVCEPYAISMAGVPLWNLVYLKGAPITVTPQDHGDLEAETIRREVEEGRRLPPFVAEVDAEVDLERSR